MLARSSRPGFVVLRNDKGAAECHATIVARYADALQLAEFDRDFVVRPEEQSMCERTLIRDIDLLVQNASLPVARYVSKRFDSIRALPSIAPR